MPGTARSRKAAERRRSIDEWTTTAGRVLALLVLVAFAVVWMTSGRVEPLLVATFGGIYSIAAGAAAFALLRQPSPSPPPIPDSTVGGPEPSHP